MLRPLIVIGCGGSGVTTVRYLRKSAKKALADAGWDGPLPQAWQFIGVDLGPQYFSGPEPMPADDYVCIDQGVSYSSIQTRMEMKHPVGTAGSTEMLGWKPRAAEIYPPITQSPGMFRPVARMAGLASLMPTIEQRLSRSLDAIRKSEDEFCQLKELLGLHSYFGAGELDPYVVVVGSMSGGTGSGIMFDIHEVVKRLKPNWTSLISIVYSDSIFDSLAGEQSAPSQANSLAFMSELLALSWNARKSSPLIEQGNNFDYLAPPLTFIIENKNSDGVTAASPDESFQLVASWLTCVAISADKQSALMYAVSEQNPRSMINSGGYGFEKVSVHSTPGVVLSFGHATISVGRDRFPEYASKLLQREVVEFLINGYQKIAIQELGKSETTTPPEEIIKSLTDRNFQKFLIDANLSTTTDLPTYLIDLVSSEAKIQSLRNSLKDDLENAIKTNVRKDSDQTENFNDAVWGVKKQNLLKNADVILQIVTSWKLGVSGGISKALNREVSNLSIPVANALLKTTHKLIGKAADQFRIQAEHLLVSSKNHKFKLVQTAESKPINQAIDSIVMEVTAQSLEYLAVELENFTNGELSDLINQIEFLQTSLETLLSSEIYSWPKIDDGVPYSFQPPSFEVCLESYETWPSSIQRLILGPDAKDEDQDKDLMKIARSAIIQGGYETKNGGLASSLIRLTDGAQQELHGTPGLFSLRVDLENHVLDWLMRPGSEFGNFVGESLNSYLSGFGSPLFNQPIENVDHEDRLKRYKEKLISVLSVCKPRIYIDHNLNAQIHRRNDLAHFFKLPFPEGHPAYEASHAILATHLNLWDNFEAYFASNISTTSVGISAYLIYPVNPSVMRHFTGTQATFAERSSSWSEKEQDFKWRRTRKLSEFIPLPTALRHAAIRGFAVGRMLGYITIDTEIAIKISGKEREYVFPRYLMTKSGPSNLLPALLESMSLCFADVPKLGQEAFGAYRELISMGATGQFVATLPVENECLKFIQTGERLRIPVDIERAARMSADTSEERTKKMLEYLELNLTRYVQVREKFNAMTIADSISAEDCLTLELIDELIENYQIVFDSIKNDKTFDIHGV